MPRTYVTDLTDFEGIDDPGSDVPGPARRIGLYFRSITEQASGGAAETVVTTTIPCRCRPLRRPCRGHIMARRHRDPPVIHWWCPQCGESGRIASWSGTRWDRSGNKPDATGLAHQPLRSRLDAAADHAQVGTGHNRNDLAVARAILTRLHEVNGEDLFMDDSECGVIVRAVVEGTQAHLLERGADGNVVTAGAEALFDHVRRLYVATWLSQAFEDEREGGDAVNEEEEIRSAHDAFDSRLLGRRAIRRR